MNNEEGLKEKKKKNRPFKYTDEERKNIKKEKNKLYYQKNKEKLQKQNLDNYFKRIFSKKTIE